MAQDGNSLNWSSQFTVTPPTHPRTPRNLPGDKITLPQSALEQLLAAAPIREVEQSSSRPRPRPQLSPSFDPFNPYTFAAESQFRNEAHTPVDRQHQLPHPLTFRLVNPGNGRVVYAGIREFSAEENEIGLSAYLRHALGIDIEDDNDDNDNSSLSSITVHAKQLPKGTYVRLRPLEAGYDPEDWKALLERHLRENFTTLTTGELLSIPGGRDRHFRFLIDGVQPEGDGICVVDTDLEVDIEALTEEQARETLRRRLEKAARPPPGTEEGSSVGGIVTAGDTVSGQVVAGEYVDYELPKWDRGEAVDIELEVADDGDADLLVSPFASRQRNRPRADEHVFADFSSGPVKRVRLQPTNVELEGAEALYISVHPLLLPGSEGGQTRRLRYDLRISTNSPHEVAGGDVEVEDEAPHEPDDVQCKNCHQWVPQRTLFLHENFCFRNNAACPQCGKVFQRRSPEWQNHWHCPEDAYHGNDPQSKSKHDYIFHNNNNNNEHKHACPNCPYDTNNLPRLAQHRTTTCPGKPILCQFCHLIVPQQDGSDLDMHDPEVLLSGLTPHEVVDGGRTTDCHLCNKIIRLRDMTTHLRHHDLQRLSRPPPRVCQNQNCGRTVANNTTTTDTLGLCSICFGPLYVDTYDPEGKSLRRRIERRYLSQLMSGCGKPWCQNEYCKTGRQAQSQPLPAAEIMSTVRPLVDAIQLQPGGPVGSGGGGGGNAALLHPVPFYFCTDETSQRRRVLAEMLAAEGATPATGGKSYELPWCVAAVEAGGGSLDKAREWLVNWAPAREESVR